MEAEALRPGLCPHWRSRHARLPFVFSPAYYLVTIRCIYSLYASFRRIRAYIFTNPLAHTITYTLLDTSVSVLCSLFLPFLTSSVVFRSSPRNFRLQWMQPRSNSENQRKTNARDLNSIPHLPKFTFLYDRCKADSILTVSVPEVAECRLFVWIL